MQAVHSDEMITVCSMHMLRSGMQYADTLTTVHLSVRCS
jgi:hypothetical protein